MKMSRSQIFISRISSSKIARGKNKYLPIKNFPFFFWSFLIMSKPSWVTTHYEAFSADTVYRYLAKRNARWHISMQRAATCSRLCTSERITTIYWYMMMATRESKATHTFLYKCFARRNKRSCENHLLRSIIHKSFINQFINISFLFRFIRYIFQSLYLFLYDLNYIKRINECTQRQILVKRHRDKNES